jgi:hypothetical protein
VKFKVIKMSDSDVEVPIAMGHTRKRHINKDTWKINVAKRHRFAP